MADFSFKKKHSILLRIWHWLTALVIGGLLTTVLFRNTFFNSSDNSKIILSKLQKSGTTISDDLAISIAKSIRQPFWEWHYFFGFTLLALVLLRIGVFFLQQNQSSNLVALSKFIPHLPKENQKDAKHYLIVRGVYTIYYFALTIMILTGLTLYFKTDLGLEKKLSGFVKTVHEYTMWTIMVFIIVHIIGVVKEEKNPRNKGIVSDMINGGR
jgi:Ni/Fe-hydrogenase 1 B-type cytochrome subunit